MMANITVDIWGSYATRDVFGIVSEKGVEIKHFFNRCSFVSAFSNKPAFSITYEDLKSIGLKRPDFERRCSLIDYSREIPAILENEHSEWLIIDFRYVLHGITTVEINNNLLYFTPSYSNYIEIALKNRKIPYTSKILPYSGLDYSQSLKSFINFCKKVYGNHIILLETVETAKELQNDGSVATHMIDGTAVGEQYRIMSTFIKETNCFFVRCPFNILGDSQHRWGYAPVHYVYEYYRYAYDVIMAIVNDSYSYNNSDYCEICATMNDIAYGRIVSFKHEVLIIDNLIKNKQYALAYERMVSSNK